CCIFFFEAEDGIRESSVTGVQTCALPISEQDLTATLARGGADSRRLAELELENAKARLADVQRQADGTIVRAPVAGVIVKPPAEIGRASCRERGKMWGVAGRVSSEASGRT